MGYDFLFCIGIALVAVGLAVIAVTCIVIKSKLKKLSRDWEEKENEVS